MPHLIRRTLALLGAATALACDSGTAPVGSIAVAMLPLSASVGRAGTATAQLTFTRSGGFTGTVNLTLTGAPTGVTGDFSDVETTGLVTTARLTLDVTAAAAPGSYSLVVHGAGTGVSEASAVFALTVSAAVAEQWAQSATASSEYTSTDWSAARATGPANVVGCADDPNAWASLNSNGQESLELTFPVSVHGSEIQIYEVWGVSSIVQVEVKDAAGNYYTVHTDEPTLSFICPRVLTIPVSGIPAAFKVVRIRFDQETLNDWNEIDAVKLVGNP